MVSLSYLKGDYGESFLNEDLLDLETYPEVRTEELDFDTLKLLEDYEMQSTMNSVETMAKLGQLQMGDNNTFIATFTEEGSSALLSLSYVNDLLNVVFRKSPSMEYQYAISENDLMDLIEEVEATLIDGEGSVGRKIQSLISNNKVQLV